MNAETEGSTEGRVRKGLPPNDKLRAMVERKRLLRLDAVFEVGPGYDPQEDVIALGAAVGDVLKGLEVPQDGATDPELVAGLTAFFRGFRAWNRIAGAEGEHPRTVISRRCDNHARDWETTVKKAAAGGGAGKSRSSKPKVAASKLPPDGDPLIPRHAFADDLDGIRRHMGGDKDPVQLTNFAARIVEALVIDDGAERTRVWRISVRCAGRVREVDVPVDDFEKLAWASQADANAVVFLNIKNAKSLVATAVRLLSLPVPERVVYAHTGWVVIDGRRLYLYAGGAIGADGPVAGIECAPGEALAGYRLVYPPDAAALTEAVRASLDMLDVGKIEVTAALLAAPYAAVLRRPRFGIYYEGESGTGKSGGVRLAQAHFGRGFSYDTLPANFSSTANYLEHVAHAAADAVFPVDDYAPGTDRRQGAGMRDAAERLFRAGGNQQGRGRLNSRGEVRPQRAPGGLVVATGEVCDFIQSIKARLLIVPVEAGDLDIEEIKRAAREHAAKGHYAMAMAGFVRWLAADWDKRQERAAELYKDALTRAQKANDDGHARAPDIVASLAAGLFMFAEFARTEAGVTCDKAWREQVLDALIGRLAEQTERQGESTVDELFVQALRAALAGGRAHLCHPDKEPGLGTNGALGAWADYGWRNPRQTKDGAWKAEPSGMRIGWVRPEKGRVYLKMELAYRCAQEEMGRSGQRIPRGPRAISGLLGKKRWLMEVGPDGRSTVQIDVEPEPGQGRTQPRVLALSLDKFLPPDRPPNEPPDQSESGGEVPF